MDDILGQGGDHEPSRWPRRLAIAAALVVLVVVLARQLPPGRGARSPRLSAAATAGPVRPLGPGPVGAGPPGQSDGIAGPGEPWAGRLRLPVAGQRPAWFWPASGRMAPLGGLPRYRPGYVFTRVTGGWALQPEPGATAGCGFCAGLPSPVYYLSGTAQSVTRIGTADLVAPGATNGALWLTSYRPGADPDSSRGTAREVTTSGALVAGPVRLPAGYVIRQATGRGLLLLAPANQRTDLTTYVLWDPAGARVLRAFGGVIAQSASGIAWLLPCAGPCGMHVLDLATGREAIIRPPGKSSVASAAFSPDGRYLAFQASFGDGGDGGALAMRLEVLSMATGRVTVVPDTWVSSDALVGFGWAAGSDDLVAELSFTTRVQLVSWHPGAARLAIVVLNAEQKPTSLVLG